MSPDVPPSPSSLQDALAAFEGFYDALEVAVLEGDAEAVQTLVDGRAEALAALQRVLAGEPLPRADAERVAGREAETTALLEQFSRDILAQLLESRQHRQALARYAETERGAEQPEESR